MKQGRKLVWTLMAAVLTLLPAAGLSADPDYRADPAGALAALSERLEVGKPLYYRNLTVIPVCAGASGRSNDSGRHATLDQALEEGWLEIREKEGGDVPWVVLSNRGDRTIFLMGGEILSGCKQDRIVARDVLIAPYRKRLLVPVYCVEAGRWQPVTGEFKSEKNLGTYALRAAAQSSSGYAQGEVWSKVAESNRKMGVSSDTEAYQDAFRDQGVARMVAEVEEKLSELPRLRPDTVGVVIGLGEQIIGLDIFSSPRLFQALWPKIVKACALSMSGSQDKGTLSRERAAELLRALGRIKFGRRRGLDLGFETFAELKGLSVNALIHEGEVLHLGAFSDSDGPGRSLSRAGREELLVQEMLPPELRPQQVAGW